MVKKVTRPTAIPANDAPETILDAMDFEHLFGPHFQGTSWTAWKAFLAALFALPMDDDQQAIYAACTARLSPPDRPFSEAALIVGRRGGKSRVLALIAVFLATFRDYGQYLAPGEVATIGILAANRSQARSIFRFVSGMLKAVPLLSRLVVKEDAETIQLSNRVVIEISTASFKTTRGYSFAAVLCDEIAFWAMEESSANPDTEILRALRPGMANIPGSILLLASSPYAKKGALYQTFRTHYGKPARVLCWKADTATMNPQIDPAIIAEAYESDPEAARAEYGAEFRDDLADFVTQEIVDSATATGRSELPPMAGIVYSGFVDPSGGASDAMTMAIGHIRSDGIVVLDCVREARPPFDPEAVVMEFAQILAKYGIDRVLGDRYGGEWPRQRFREHGIAYDPNAAPKSDLYLNLLPLLNAGRVELLDNKRLAAQLVGLERRTARSGKDSVDHVPGGHDDLINAVAGVLTTLDLDRRPALISPAQMQTNENAVPMPPVINSGYAIVVAGNDGQIGISYFAKTVDPIVPLILVDFDAGPITGRSLTDAFERLKNMRFETRVRTAVMLFVAPELVSICAEFGIAAIAIPAQVTQNLAATMLAASGHVAQGRVKICDIAAEKAKSHPLGGAINMRAGDDLSQPLRMSILIGVFMGIVVNNRG